MAAPVTHADSDVQVWSSAGVSTKLSENLSLGFDQHLRLEDNSSELSGILSDISVRYRLTKWLRLSSGYRFAYKRDGEGELALRHRFHGDADLRHKIGSFRLGLRTRWQETIRGANGDDGIRHKWRNRGKIVWRASKSIHPFASLELMHAIGNDRGFVFDTARVTTGAAYQLGGGRTLKAFYRIDLPQDDTTDDPTLHILGLSATFDL